MGVTRGLLTASALVAVALAPVVPAAAADSITWPQVQGAARAAQRNLEQGGGTVSVQVSAKISYRTVTDYQPGGSVQRERYREAGMAASEPAVVTWTVTGTGADRRYQPMPRLPKPGAYPTLRKASWVRLNPPSTTDVTPPLLRLNVLEPLGEIASSPADAEGIITASWTHGVGALLLSPSPQGWPNGPREPLSSSRSRVRTSPRVLRLHRGRRGGLRQSKTGRAELPRSVAGGLRGLGDGRCAGHDDGPLLGAQCG